LDLVTLVDYIAFFELAVAAAAILRFQVAGGLFLAQGDLLA
jgi:hypothetical protein